MGLVSAGGFPLRKAPKVAGRASRRLRDWSDGAGLTRSPGSVLRTRRIGFAGRCRAAARRASVRPVDRRIHDTRITVHPIVRSGIGRYNLSYMRPSSVRSRDKQNPARFGGNRDRAAVPQVFPAPNAVEGPAPSAWHRRGLRLAVRRRPPRGVAFPVHPRAGGAGGGDAVAPMGVVGRANGCAHRQSTAVGRHLFRVAPFSQPAGPLFVVRRSLASLPPRRRFNLCDLPR